jgi:hypothetical protein
MMMKTNTPTMELRGTILVIQEVLDKVSTAITLVSLLLTLVTLVYSNFKPPTL